MSIKEIEEHIEELQKEIKEDKYPNLTELLDKTCDFYLRALARKKREELEKQIDNFGIKYKNYKNKKTMKFLDDKLLEIAQKVDLDNIAPTIREMLIVSRENIKEKCGNNLDDFDSHVERVNNTWNIVRKKLATPFFKQDAFKAEINRISENIKKQQQKSYLNFMKNYAPFF